MFAAALTPSPLTPLPEGEGKSAIIEDSGVRGVLPPNTMHYLLHDIEPAFVSFRSVVSLLKEGRFDPNKTSHKDLLASCETALTISQAIIHDALQIEKFKSGVKPPEFVESDLSSIARDAVSFARPFATEKGLKIEFRESGNPRSFPADATMLTRVLVNLLFNAIKNSSEGTVTLECSHGIKENIVRIMDEGKGIREGIDLDELFDPWKQMTMRAEGEYSGVGLGLSFCKTALRRLGGKISAERRRPRGMIFKVAL